MYLKLWHGPKLYLYEWTYDESLHRGYYAKKDITDESPFYLFFPRCYLADDVTLRDLFMLTRQHMPVMKVVLNSWCDEFVSEGLDNEPKRDSEIECLELSFTCEQDSDGLTGNMFPFFGGQSETENYSVSFAKCYELIDLPVKLGDFGIWHILPTGYKEDRIKNPEFSLGQILYGVFWELGWYGNPERRDERAKEIFDMKNEAKERLDNES